MKTTNLAVSLLSVSLMVPGFTALLSGTAEAQTNQKVACPQNYQNHVMKEGEQIRFIAKDLTGSQKNWKFFYNPQTQQLFTEQQAEELSEGDLVCIPKKLLLRR